MNPIKSLISIIKEGPINFIQRKRNKTFLDNRTLFTINYNGKKTKIFLNKKFGYVDKYIFDNGIYEQDIIDDIRAELSPEKTLLDIGGNIGQHSLLLAPYCKNIYAFEPIPVVYEEFKKSIKANKYQNIILHNIAVGNKEEKKTIYFSPKNAGATTLLPFEDSGRIKIDVKINLLENVLPQNIKFDVVKMDVEGYEAVVILGNKEILIKNKPVIFLEFCPSEIDRQGTFSSKELLEFFFSNGFEIYNRSLKKTFTENHPDLNRTENLIIRPKSIDNLS